jgi:two-component system, LytTR family, response regulator AlgR
VTAQRLRVLIVDDEEPARQRLRDLLTDCAREMPLEVVGEAANGRQALDMLSEAPVDVVLLDIRMPEMDGIELARHTRTLDAPPAVIFTSAYDDYALRAFEVHAVDYLLKPIRQGRLHEALLRARTMQAPTADVLRAIKPEARSHLAVNERGRIHLVPVASIVFLKAELKYVTLRTAEREYLTEESLMALELEFGNQFVRVHRNCLVARSAIRGFQRAAGPDGEGHWLVLLNGVDEKLAVSRRQQHIVREIGKVSL